jgi:Bacterial SH3 domain
MGRVLRFPGCLLLALLTLAACGRRPAVERIELPSTPVLSIRSTWAVVTSPFLRVRDEPLADAAVLAHIRRGAVLEVLSRTDRKEDLEQTSSYWYQVSYEGLRGWVFGAFLEIVDTKAQAESLAAELD